MEREKQEKRELARARLESKRARVRGIRRKVAVLAASLAVAFSGVILTQTAVGEFSGQSQAASTTAGEDPGVDETLGATVVSAATELVFRGDDDEDDEEEAEGGIGSFFNSSSSTPAESSQS